MKNAGQPGRTVRSSLVMQNGGRNARWIVISFLQYQGDAAICGHGFRTASRPLAG